MQQPVSCEANHWLHSDGAAVREEEDATEPIFPWLG
jgi:hypothetical protein